MLTKSEARQQIAAIHGILERSTRYTNVSPWAAFSVGLAGLGTAAWSQHLAGTPDQYGDHLPTLAILWSGCLVMAVALAAGFSISKARRQSERLWTAPLQQALINFAMAALLGGTLTGLYVRNESLHLIPSAWMMCYGVGLVTGGVFSLRIFRHLGLSFIACGALAGFFPLLNHWLMMLSFGLGHMVLGLVVQKTSAKTTSDS